MTDRPPKAVDLAGLSPESQRSVGLIAARAGITLVSQRWVPLTQMGILEAHLREAEDTPETFPRGKWATIQAYQGLVEKAILKLPGKQTA